MQDSKKDTDVYSGLLDSEGEGGMIWENGTETCIWHIKKNIQIKIYCSSESGIGIVKSLGDIVIKSLHSILFLVYYKLLPKNVSHGWTEKVFQ